MWALVAAIRALGQFLGWNFTQLWEALKKVFGTRWAAFILIVGVCFLIVQDAVGALKYLAGLLAEYAIQHFNLSLSGQLLQIFAIANYIAPVAEAIAFLIGYGVLVGIMTIYRHVKSMIPSPLPGGGGT